MKTLYEKLPISPGVYLMKGERGKILYIGKAGNLRRRVSSYFLRPHDYRIQKLVREIKKIEYKKTDTAIEALILEAELIKKHQPPYNVREKDDTSFLYVEFTKEAFPRVLLVRGHVYRPRPAKGEAPQMRGLGQAGKSKPAGERYGPFTSAGSIREALKIMRRIFPYGTHPNLPVDNRWIRNSPARLSLPQAKSGRQHSHTFEDSHYESRRRPCFEYEIGLCPGTCVGAINQKEYAKNIKNLKLFFRGKKGMILTSLEHEMKAASKALEFEKAETIRRQIFALQHIQDVALIGDNELTTHFSILTPHYRIEGYDISNISGTSAVGSMVVFRGDKPDKNEYRKFKIRTIQKSDDVGMLKEVLRRRFRHPIAHGDLGWPLPNLILIDGGRGQVNAAKHVLSEAGLKIPVIGIAKGPERKRNDIIGIIPKGVEKRTLIRVRDEAHRFAITYHKKLRGIQSMI
ncbi:MAG: excinuclease ABC subunit UvrC [Candidatus Liptonbacteria bacterium]|nr:excinuclease ABC subunit UvrC [Candidatus Liptonbacteria bacterium]